ncbi:FAD-dependent oxidoreductase [Archangium lansingense]|uniref:FAD-dependent oxidoreductase n=1 Tax=Archangium lansingense TaxID=2995310 RepID=UPI003B7A1D90
MEERIVTVGAGQAGGELAAGLLSCQVRGLELDEARRQVRGVRLACHGVEERLEADLVLVGIGLLPNTELASAAGLAVDNGIVVDEFACTADLDILAIGDCANQPSAYTGGRIRIESVPNQTKAARSSTPGRPGFFFHPPFQT